MPETWIAIAAPDRRRYLRWTGFTAGLFALMTAAVLVPDSSGREASGWLHWCLIGIFGACGLLAVGHLVNRTLGRTALTADGMRFHTFVSRRLIAWTEITDIVEASHSTRGGPWWELRVQRRHGRSLAVPGTFTNRACDDALSTKLAVIRHYRSRASR